MNNNNQYIVCNQREKKLNEKNNIDFRFKIIYFVGIICVILSHCQRKASIELNIQGWFEYTTFHMPLFMFAAGYFFKEKNVSNIFKYLIRKFKRLILPIYSYNIFYGIIIQILKKIGFKNNIREFSFRIVLVEPLNGSGFKYIRPSWFSSSLFFVESYNILKRKVLYSLKKEIHESIYLIIDVIISCLSVSISNKNYNTKYIYMYVLRFMHLNIYYELGIFYNKHLEYFIKKIRYDFFFLCIFSLKLLFHLYYSHSPSFYYGASQYFNYSPFTVIIISILGISFWLKISEIMEPLLGKNYYVNIIADNTFSIMINHGLAIDLVKTFFAIISKYSRYCQNFDFKKYYSLDTSYIFIPNNVLQAGILYLLTSLIVPIFIQKIINKIKNKIFKIK